MGFYDIKKLEAWCMLIGAIVVVIIAVAVFTVIIGTVFVLLMSGILALAGELPLRPGSIIGVYVCSAFVSIVGVYDFIKGTR